MPNEGTAAVSASREHYAVRVEIVAHHRLRRLDDIGQARVLNLPAQQFSEKVGHVSKHPGVEARLDSRTSNHATTEYRVVLAQGSQASEESRSCRATNFRNFRSMRNDRG